MEKRGDQGIIEREREREKEGERGWENTRTIFVVVILEIKLSNYFHMILGFYSTTQCFEKLTSGTQFSKSVLEKKCNE